jgi:phenylpropionate dioxygenase-like ring-hydroxylating dioxygenase large terminal subunit
VGEAMIVKNCWYVAAFGDEVTSRPLGRRIADQPIVLFRTAAGAVCVLEDRCCHRGLPLSLGYVDGSVLRCNYHGLEFDGTGACVKVPGQDLIPTAARVRSYPAVEDGKAIWVWMGDAAKAEPSAIPQFPWFKDPAWAWKSKLFTIRCNYEMLHDNLLDLTHVAYVHSRTIGGSPDTHFNAETKVSRSPTAIKVVRLMPDSVPPPTYSKLVRFGGRVDRWQEFEFTPGLISLYSGAVDVGTGAYEGRREGGFHLRLFDAVTPETETTTLNFFCAGHNFRIDEPAVTDLLFDELERTVLEDIEVLEAQQARAAEAGENAGRSFVDIRADAASIQARRLLNAMRQREGSAPADQRRSVAL